LSLQLARKDFVEVFTPGQQLDIEEMFKVGEEVDVAGKTIGKGFQGGPETRVTQHK